MKTLKLFTVMGLGLALLVGCSNDSGPVEPVEQGNFALRAQQIFVPADATIDSAAFFVRVNSASDEAISLHRVTSAWTEGAVTWTGFAGAFDAQTLGGFTAGDTGWFATNVTDLAKGWFDSSVANYGILLKQGDTATPVTGFDSRESDNKPYFEVCYTVHEGSFCETFEVDADAYIYQLFPDSNFGGEASLYTGRDTATDSTRQSLASIAFPVQIRYTKLGDRVWLDDNRDGIQDDGEEGLADVKVRLYTCEETLLDSTMSDADGMYMFDSLLAGDYLVEFVTPERFQFSPAKQGSDDAVDSDADPETGRTACVTLLPGEMNMNVDAGMNPIPAVIGDFVWNDLNENGIQDEGEPGLNGIKVMLYTCDGLLVDSTMSDSGGMYAFDGLEAGDYYLQFFNPFGYILTLQNQGDDDELDSDPDQISKTTICITVEPGDSAMSWDAGLFAFEGCTYGKGYWKNRTGFGPQPDEVTPLLPIWLGNDGGSKSLAVTDAQIAYDVLQQHEYGHPSNGITKLYAHLLTTKLNINNFANPEDVYDFIQTADDFLAEYDWNDWDSLSKDQQKMVLKWKGKFEDYNEGEIGPGHCDDDEDGDEED
jgi:hypothetical protein